MEEQQKHAITSASLAQEYLYTRKGRERKGGKMKSCYLSRERKGPFPSSFHYFQWVVLFWLQMFIFYAKVNA